MIYYNACPRCKGTVEHRQGLFTPELRCLPCGWRIEKTVSEPRSHTSGVTEGRIHPSQGVFRAAVSYDGPNS